MLDDAYKNTDLIRATANGYAEYKFTDYLSLNTLAGAILTSSKGKEFYSKYTTMGNLNNGVAVLQERRSQTWNSTTRLNYLRTYNRVHKVDLMTAFEINRYNYEYQNMRGVDFVDESTGINDISKASMITGIKSTRWANNRLSWLARANYSLFFKYLFTASFRVDGSDKFGPSNRYGYFPSMAFAWQIHKEKFMKPLGFVSELKMRLSYGETGNERIPAYRYYSEMSNAYYASGGNNLFGMEPSSRANPNLKWETTVQYNAGLDLGILKNRLRISADYYIKQTRDMLLPAYIAAESGYGQQWKNIGRVDNSGFEFQVTSINVVSKNFSWSTNFNISTNKNVVKNLGGVEFIPVIMSNGTISNLGRVSLGNSIGTGYGYVRDGVYQIDDFTWQNNSDPSVPHASRQYALKPDVPSVAGATVKPGAHKFRDLNGDMVVNDEYDRTFISRSLPKHFGGIGNTFTYKNFELSAFFEWSYGKQIINLGKRLIEGPSGGAWNLSADFWQNRWTPDNPTNGYADFLANNTTAGMMSSYYVEDGSYLRLQTVSAAYNFPKSLARKIGINNVQLYATGNNLFVWTNYSGFDPDVNYTDPMLTGIDRLAYPRAKSLIFGLKFSL
jgi:TonB-linked SusC/RagA family outer membrane protein